MADRMSLKLIMWLVRSSVLMSIVCRPIDGVDFSFTASSLLVVEGDSVEFVCTVTGNTSTNIPLKWIRNDTEEISDNLDRFSVVDINGPFDQKLFINNTTVADTGDYRCDYNGQRSRVGKLKVLPKTWHPTCERKPNSGTSSAGDPFTITCTSTGHVNTSLRWLVPNGLEPPSPDKTIRKDKTISITYNGTKTDANSEPVFVCQAALDNIMSHTCMITIKNTVQTNVIPFVVVGLMSLIALLLFVVVLTILFRHRQCRFCREAMLEPHVVLDANSLQTGAWVPPPVVSVDVDAVSEDGDRLSVRDGPHHYENLDGILQPPDVVPSQEPVASTAPEGEGATLEPNSTPRTTPHVRPEVTSVENDVEFGVAPKHKKKNLTLNKNMDQKFEKPVQTREKKPIAPPKRTTRRLEKKEKKVIKHYEEPPVKARLKAPIKDPIYAQIKKLNIPSKSALDKSADIQSISTEAETGPTKMPTPLPSSSTKDTDSKDTISVATGETDITDQSEPSVNDLGGGGERESSKKKRPRHYRKRSEEVKRPSQDSNITPNIPVSTDDSQGNVAASPSPTSDRIIYAELDFTKNVGLNILE